MGAMMNSVNKAYDKVQTGIKQVTTKVIANIVTASLVLSIVLIAFISVGASLDINFSDLRFQLYSIVLFLTAIMLFFISKKRGKSEGEQNKEYKEVLTNYRRKSIGVDLEIMREYLTHERERRRGEIENIIIERIGISKNEIYELTPNNLWRLIKSKQAPASLYKSCVFLRNTKEWKLAFKTAEQIKCLDIGEQNQSGEMPVGSEKVYVITSAVKIITTLIPKAFISASIVMAVTGNNPIQAIVQILAAVFIFMLAVADGRHTGMRSVTHYRKNTFKTAIAYIDECAKFAIKEGKPFQIIIGQDDINKAVDCRISEAYKIEETEGE
jgi:energy-coupling factor transporter transmembrane protein EcfT